MEIKEALLRNILIGRVGDQKFEIKYTGGYIVFDWGDKTTRLQKAANGVDSLIPLPDGSMLRLKPDFTLLCA